MSPDREHSFHIADYVVFGSTIVISLAIGLYFALSGGRQRTTSEFLVGGRAMRFIPVAVSLMVSFESSIMMLGLPAETYVYGAQYWISVFGWLTVFLLSNIIMIPVIHPLRITSAYEYLNDRFQSRLVRLTGVVLGMLGYIFYMGIVLFGPGIALEAVTGFPLVGSIFLVAFAAIIYTAMGGLKAVIWTDVFQAFVMFAGLFAVLIKVTMTVGGVKEAWTRAYKGGRLDIFNFDPDPTVRHTFWGLYFGTTIRGMGLAFNQSTIQRVCSTPTLKEAKKVMYIVGPAFWLGLTLACIEGILAYSYYDYLRCDPLSSNKITDPNQIVPYMVMEIFKTMPGMPGLFLAALFSASLSTVSSGLSSLSALAWEDVLKPHFPNFTEFKATIVAKVSVVVFGLFSCGVAILISLIGGPLTQITGSISAGFSGPLCGLFFLASLCPWANAKGAFVGTFASAVLMTWISLGSSFAKVNPTPWLPLPETDQCGLANMTSSLSANLSDVMTSTESALSFTTSTDTPSEGPQGVEKLYMLSYTWFGCVGIALTLSIGFVVSWMTGFNRKQKVDSRYLVPIAERLCCCLPKSVREFLGCGENEKDLEAEIKETVYDTQLFVEPDSKKETTLPLIKGLERRHPADVVVNSDDADNDNDDKDNYHKQ